MQMQGMGAGKRAEQAVAGSWSPQEEDPGLQASVCVRT